jgi:hypothetical protein
MGATAATPVRTAVMNVESMIARGATHEVVQDDDALDGWVLAGKLRVHLHRVGRNARHEAWCQEHATSAGRSACGQRHRNTTCAYLGCCE